MKILITAGPTREPIDAMRFISNRSSGRVGLALAGAAGRAGHPTTLLLGPVAMDAQGIERAIGKSVALHRFDTSNELRSLLEIHWPGHDVLIMAAAVADFRPVGVREGKPSRDSSTRTLELEPTPDLVAAMARSKRSDQLIVAFALEQADNLAHRAGEKLRRKGVDVIVGNPLATVGNQRIAPLWLTARGQRDEPGSMTKADFAVWLMRKIEAVWSARADAPGS